MSKQSTKVSKTGDNQAAKSQKASSAKKDAIPAFALARENYMLIIAGIVLITLGFILMIGGGADHPSEFSDTIFSPVRITVAPLLVLTGYVVEIIAIMYKPKAAKSLEE